MRVYTDCFPPSRVFVSPLAKQVRLGRVLQTQDSELSEPSHCDRFSCAGKDHADAQQGGNSTALGFWRASINSGIRAASPRSKSNDLRRKRCCESDVSCKESAGDTREGQLRQTRQNKCMESRLRVLRSMAARPRAARAQKAPAASRCVPAHNRCAIDQCAHFTITPAFAAALVSR